MLGCSSSKYCTLVGCLPALTLEFSETLPPGKYTLVLTSEDVSGRCDLELRTPTSWDYCESHSAQLSAGRLEIYDNYESYDVLLQDEWGQVVAQQSYRPEYRVSYPNGEDCGECRTATDTLMVSAAP